MAKYESLPTTLVTPSETVLPSHDLPELVRLDDAANTVMTDFRHAPAHIIAQDRSMDDALNEMKFTGEHLLLVTDKNGHLIGIISSQDLLGDKPIKILQEKRMPRENITVKMLMVEADTIISLDIKTVETARVGHIVKTLTENKRHYALVTEQCQASEQTLVRGLFTTSQISKQLHMDLDNAIATAGSISELQKRHGV